MAAHLGVSRKLPYLKTTCCIPGGGPAGIMLGYLLARAGIDVIVLEKHADFFRDFRGDTVHPSTLDLLDQLGLLDDFLKVPHSEVTEFDAIVGGVRIPGPRFSHLPSRCKFVAFMPQWDFLNFLAERAKRYPTFRLLMNTEATGLRYDGERVCGVDARGPDGPLEIDADLVVACDGRGSILRIAAGLAPVDYGSPIDVLWMRLPRLPSDPGHLLATIGGREVMIMIDRNDYWQCAFVIAKDTREALEARGLPAFQSDILKLAPYLGRRVEMLRSWDDIKLLTVKVDRLAKWWRPGLLFIGDAAHAMSPIGGVGINYAVQDAVAAAARLREPLRDGAVTDPDLAAVQARREPPVRRMQGIQVAIQKQFISNVLSSGVNPTLVQAIRILLTIAPGLRDLAGRVVGLGFQEERIESPEATA